MARVPTIAEEDAKRPNRERDERTWIVNRIKSTLARLGIRNFKPTLRKAQDALSEHEQREGRPPKRLVSRGARLRPSICTSFNLRAKRAGLVPAAGKKPPGRAPCDNLNTHKPKHDRWLARHKNVHFHFTPTHASWLNQVYPPAEGGGPCALAYFRDRPP